jgi:ketosteroid isomerase-like protein
VTKATDTHSALPSPATAAMIDRMFDALARGDVAAARACCTPDVVVWHSFDRQPVSLAGSGAWEKLATGFAGRSFVDIRRSAVPGGWVQRNQLIARTPSGARLAWPMCLFVTLRDGLIDRIDEYIDRAGHYEPSGDEPSTPGLPPARPDAVL